MILLEIVMKPTLYIDQYGNKYYARTLKQLKSQIPGKVFKIYWKSVKNGKTYHCGYVIGSHWLNAYCDFMKEVK